VSYYNGNEESKEESGRKEEEVSPSPLYRYRYVFLTKPSATGFRCARFLFPELPQLEANAAEMTKEHLCDRTLEQRTNGNSTAA
jgi:hypothetical protein